MRDICVITGGGGAMGLVAAKRLAEDDMKIVLADNSRERLNAGLAELASLGIDAVSFLADCTSQDECRALASFAAEQGIVKGLINLAGISPKVAPQLEDVISGQLVFDIAALGTIYTSSAIFGVMVEGGCVINISSTSPYLSSPGTMFEDLYPLAKEDATGFQSAVHEVLKKLEDEEGGQKSRNRGYVIARNFIKWYTEWLACQQGANSIRVVSISPGVVDGPMVEESGLKLAKMSALGRTGTPDEMAEVYSFIMSDKASYITGTNILCDGGIVAAMHNRA